MSSLDRDSRRDVILLVGLAASVMLSSTSFGMVAPFLLLIAEEFQTTLAAMGQLVGVMSVAWATAALVGGPLSDRFGRKPVLLAGLTVMAISNLLTGLVWNYDSMFALRVLGGVGGSFINPIVLAIVADHFPLERRGRAYSWTLGGIALSAVVGVPVMTVLGALTTWRTAFVAIGSLMLILAITLASLIPAPARRTSTEAGNGLFRNLGQVIRIRGFLPMLVCNTLDRFCFNATSTYLASFLIARYAVPLDQLGPVLSLVAVGSLFGVVAGGRVADRASNKGMVFVAGQVLTGCCLVPLFLVAPGLLISAALGAAFGIVGGSTRPSLTVLLTNLSQRARGAVVGIAATSNNIGHASGASIGGLVVGSGGYGALAFAIGGFALASALIGLFTFGAQGPRATAAAPRT